MGSDWGSDTWNESPESRRLRDAREERLAGRKILREMVKGELEAGSLNWWKRRQLINFAEHLGIDRYEAGLLVRAAEFDIAVAPLDSIREFEARQESISTMDDRRSRSMMLVGLIAPLAIAFLLIYWWNHLVHP